MAKLEATQVQESCAEGQFCAALNQKLQVVHIVELKAASPIDHQIMRLAAEMASKDDAQYFLKDLIVVVDVEPCFMCAMALVHSRATTVVFKHPNPSDGGLVSLHNGWSAQIFNQK